MHFLLHRFLILIDACIVLDTFTKLSLGDARAYYLSTAKNELGVVSAESTAGNCIRLSLVSPAVVFLPHKSELIHLGSGHVIGPYSFSMHTNLFLLYITPKYLLYFSVLLYDCTMILRVESSFLTL